jgi:hypothetical protein
MFVWLFPKKKDELPAGNLQKLVEAFDTIEDPVLAMKLTSVKRGVKGTIALAQSHGEEVDWEKVGSSYACPPAEMKEFFKKAKGCAPKACVPDSSCAISFDSCTFLKYACSHGSLCC